jgi:murein DD-endopeptidase MepM/ murein hydrolase activator NlpD
VHVKVGQKVKQGQLIGYQGDAPRGVPGCSTATNGVHLHFSVHEMGRTFKNAYTSWGQRCDRSDFYYELGGPMSCPANPSPAKAVNPELARYLGTLKSPVRQTCK